MYLVQILFLSFLLSSNLTIYAQHKKEEIHLTEMKIHQDKLKKILSFVIAYEKNCDYYNEDLIFIVDLKTINTQNFIRIESINDRNLALDSEPYGFFYQKKHLFLISGDKADNLLFDTQIKKQFSYLKYDVFYEEYNSMGQQILPVIIDDSHTEWEFFYFQNEFIFEDLNSSCE